MRNLKQMHVLSYRLFVAVESHQVNGSYFLIEGLGYLLFLPFGVSLYESGKNNRKRAARIHHVMYLPPMQSQPRQLYKSVAAQALQDNFPPQNSVPVQSL